MSTSDSSAGRRLVIAAGGTATGLVLLMSYHTSLNGTPVAAASTTLPAGVSETTATTTTDTTTTGSAGDPTTTAGTAGSAAATPAPSASAPISKTVTGSVAQTRWGPVQVRITVSGSTITGAEAVVVPTGNHRDDEINGYAVPVLNGEVVSAQSTQIDSVSGATVTSGGYQQSLQSAIDAAHLS